MDNDVSGDINNPIFIVKRNAREDWEIERFEQLGFSDIGIKEVDDLQRWIVKHPEILGEPLLIVKSEFSGFKASNRRLDVIALDQDGILTIIELKLALSGTFADLQIIRYAAMVENMRMEDVVRELANYHKISKEEAVEKIRSFLGLESDPLPELDKERRLVIATGAVDDKELTATILWLRSYNIDISCVEIRPYRLPSNEIVLVPQIIIPVPEAKEFMVEMEREKACERARSREQFDFQKYWQELAEEFNKLNVEVEGHKFQANVQGAKGGFSQIRYGHPWTHYEWLWRKGEKQMDVALHFEYGNLETNLKWLNEFKTHSNAFNGIPNDWSFEVAPWGQKSAHIRFKFAEDSNFPSNSQIPRYAQAMKVLIEKTWPLLSTLIKKEEESQK